MKQAGQGAKAALSDYVQPMMVIKGILVSYLITIPLFIVFALILSYVDFPERLISSVVLITTIASVVTAGALSTKRVKNKGWLNGSIVGFVYMLILYLVGSIALKNFSIDRNVLLIVIAGILSGSIGGIIGINFKSGGYMREMRNTRNMR